LAQKRRRKQVSKITTDRFDKRFAPQSRPTRLEAASVSEENLQKYMHIFAIVVLLGFGSYIAIQFYGHQAVPNSDFPAFEQTGREILSFKQPSSYKRTPGLGILHVVFSYVMPGPHPVLTAGWVLNALFHALLAVLLYLVARELVGPSAVWYALLATLNPWVIVWMRHPLAETPLIFFTVLTFYLTFKRSRWSYAAAMMASMIRYEGAAMIMIAFIGDIIYSKTWRPILWAFLAAIPLFLATFLQIIPPLADVIKIPLLKFQTLYDLKRFALAFPLFGVVVVCLIRYRKREWAYLPAGVASVISLLAGLLLILGIFAWDQYKSTLWRKLVPKLLLVLLASLPMVFWLYGTKQARGTKTKVADYSRGYSPDRDMVIGQFSDYVWQLGVSSYFVTDKVEIPVKGRPGITRTGFIRVTQPSQILYILSVIFALGYAIYKKHVPALLVFSFLALYFLAHATRNGTRPRYAIPIAWVSFLIAWYGIHHFWILIQSRWKIPRYVSMSLQILILPAVIIWLSRKHMPKISFLEGYSYYSTYEYIPYVAITVVALIFLARFAAYRGRTLVKDLALSMLVILMLVSNHFLLTTKADGGRMDIEFKDLATWARNPNNVKPDEKLVVTMPHVVKIFAPKIADNLVATNAVIGSSPSEFVQRCQLADIAYVAWDSRIGYALTNTYYHSNRIRYMRMWNLLQEADNGPFEYIYKIGPDRVFKNRFINIFRLDRLQGDVTTAPEFQLLADWYNNLTEKKTKLVSAKADILRQLAPKTQHFFWHTGGMWGKSPTQFLQACYRNNITYIAWDSRSGLNTEDPYYRKWRLHRILRLQEPKDIAPYEFVTQLKNNNGEFINIFRLDTPPSLQAKDHPEFKMLAQWYSQNAYFPDKSKRPQILITSAPALLRKFCLYNDDYFWHTSSIWGDTAEEFLQRCWRNGVSYVAWDSFYGTDTESELYKTWRLDRIQMLSEPQSVGPYQFVQQFKVNDEHTINLFRLLRPASDIKK
jgi:hypothetical protein